MVLLLLLTFAVGYGVASNINSGENQQEEVILDNEVENNGNTDEFVTRENPIEVRPPEEDDNSEELLRLEALLSEQFEDIFRVEYDEENHAYLLHVIDKELAESISHTLLGTVPKGVWNDLFEQLTNLSRTISLSTDEEVLLVLLNPFSPDKAILIVQNGEQLSNLFK